MARQTKRGICELCGAHTNVGMNHGSKACPACTHVQTALNKRPEAVAKAIRAMHKTEELLGHLIPAGGLAVKVTADLLQEISGIVGYQGEDPGELVAAVRRLASGGAQQLTSEAEAGALRTIAGIVGYEGTDGEQLVEAVRRRVLTCASCETEEVLGEVREIVGYSPNMGDSGLADAVRALVGELGARSQFIGAEQSRDDLLRACGVEYSGQDWDVIVAAAVQTIANLNERNRLLHNHVGLGESQLTKLRAELTMVEQSHDEWEQRALEAEINVETLEAELREWENSPVPCTDNTLLDIALKALRGEGPDADQLAVLIDAARRAA